MIYTWFIQCLKLVYSKTYFNLTKYLFWSCSKWWSDSVPGLNKGLSSNFWWLIGTNYVKFTEKCVICTEKHVLSKKDLNKPVKCGFVPTSLSWKHSLLKENTLSLQWRWCWQSSGTWKKASTLISLKTVQLLTVLPIANFFIEWLLFSLLDWLNFSWQMSLYH